MRSYESIVKPITKVSKSLLKLIKQAQGKRDKNIAQVNDLHIKRDDLSELILRAEATAKKLEALVS